ncbi:MAG TPA: ABC transporter substrate-binding protein [Candidatus Limnocylindrales bacterium]
MNALESAVRHRHAAIIPALLAAVLVVGCSTAAATPSGKSSVAGSTSGASSGASTAATPDPVALRLGYLPNLTHAPAIIGLEGGYFASALGAGSSVKSTTFNAGPDAVTALLSGALDAAFIGPNPAINAFSKSNGSVKIIAGVASGGASLVVKSSIKTAADLKGTKLADPQLGGTQDVALRTWLAKQGYATDINGGGAVHVLPQANSQTLETFKAGQIDGAWVPEPWATQLVQAGGKVLVDERSLWPNGQFATTVLIVRTDFLAAHPVAVSGLLSGLVDAEDLIASDPTKAQQLTNQGLTKVAGKPIPDAVLTGAWPNLTFTVDPLLASLQTSEDHAVALGFVKATDLKAIADLGPLNEILRSKNRTPIAAP